MGYNTTISAAVIGYGGMGGWHTEKIQQLPGIELIGIYDILDERCKVSEKKGIKAYCSREALLADERIDLVTVATPNDFHKEIVIAALEAGKHVICEKPVAMNSADLEEMIAVADKTGKLFTVHQNRRWDEDYLCAKHILDNNLLGRVYNIESRVQGDRGIPGDWRNRKEQGGGMVLDWGVHLLDQILMLKEKQKLISVYAQLTNVTIDEVDDGFKTMLKFDDDTCAYVEVTTSNFVKLPRWYILGENGSAVIEDWDRKGKIVMVSDWENRDAVPIQAGAGLTKTMAPRTDDTIKEYPLPVIKSDWGEYYKNVIAAIQGNEQPLITHEQVRRSTKLMEAIFESHATNSVVKFE